MSGAAVIVRFPVAEDLPSDPGWTRLKEYLIARTGLDYYADKDVDLARRIHGRLAEIGASDCAAFLRFLREDSRGPVEMDALIGRIAIGETYFFRHREHFDAIRDVVLPDIEGRNGSGRHLRVWCAGCADGAEPYSLAILLRHELAGDWQTAVLATDIGRQYLASKSEGKFEAWSLRATPESIREACFERQGRQWILRPEYREGISFERHNLASDSFPPAAHGGAFDLIVCRNVMIYFAPELMRRVILQFHDCLAPGGWLLVGPSEPNMTDFAAFRTVNAPGVTLYQKPVAALVQPVAAAVSFIPAIAPLADAPARLPLESSTSSTPASTPASTRASTPSLDELRALANEGDWDNALRCGRRLAQSEKFNPLVHFHFGLALEQAGQPAAAELSLRKAIYLDRGWAPAHFHLGVLLRTRGDLLRAERSFNNALAALAAEPPTRVILVDRDGPGAGGVTAAELSSLARIEVEGLRKRL
jgi:chemotaxis protein methyltransferase CheR